MKKVFFPVLLLFLFFATNSSLAQTFTDKEMQFLGSILGGCKTRDMLKPSKSNFSEDDVRMSKKSMENDFVKYLVPNKVFMKAYKEAKKKRKAAPKIAQAMGCMIPSGFFVGYLFRLKVE